ncbi:MAG: hypothetical protein JNL09_09080 [Anaerolineales bacterium]|nr:hypothetical protein [Anaerolineales bacterium]
MTQEGPYLETLTRRLAETPPDFLAEPIIDGRGVVEVQAVVGDLLHAFGVERVGPAPLTTQRNHLRLTLLACWLLADEWFKRHGQRLSKEIAQFLNEGIQELAASGAAEKFTTDADRREELVRVSLAHLGLRPAGENEAQAQDRLMTISSSERQRVIKAARVAEERARQIREEMARKAAEEAQAKAMRE